MGEISRLRNLGPASESVLAEAGITKADTLRRLGSVEAYARAVEAGAKPNLNLLFAIEGALTDRHWARLGGATRSFLILAADDRLSRGC